jgi:thymidylate synthase (FAD)
MSSLPTVNLLDHGYLSFVEHWGSDQRIVEAARMSTDKGFLGWGPKRCPTCEGSQRIRVEADPDSTFSHRSIDCSRCKGKGYLPGDESLLRYLYENWHHSPFEQAGMTIEVQAPILVFREWHRHRTQSYNEMSGRYIELPDLYYVPSPERMSFAKQATKNKQSSDAGLSEGQVAYWRNMITETYRYQRRIYESMLQDGVAREVARVVIPVGQYSRMRASANLRNWLAFLTLRTDTAAQWEIRAYAIEVGNYIQALYPRTWDLFVEQQKNRSAHK